MCEDGHLYEVLCTKTDNNGIQVQTTEIVLVCRRCGDARLIEPAGLLDRN